MSDEVRPDEVTPEKSNATESKAAESNTVEASLAGDRADDSSSCEVRLEFFEGPLDLLIHLLRENEVDVYDIPITTITEQYLAYLETMSSVNLEIAGEFLVMAATLAHIKSQMLLPQPEVEGFGEESGVDPRLELVERLLEYQRFKEAAGELREREIDRLDSFSRTSQVEIPDVEFDAEEGSLADVSLFDLLGALQDVLDRFPEETFHELTVETISVTDRINWLMGQLETTSHVVFQEIFAQANSRREIVVTFQALLEVVRLQLIRIVQMHRFGPIHLYRAAEVDEEATTSNGSSTSESHH